MPSNIILKKSSVVNKVPLTTDLQFGELALNYADGKLYYKKSDGTTIDAFQAGSTSQLHLGDTAPVNPAQKPFWWDSTGGVLYVYYTDVDGSQWVPATPSPSLQALIDDLTTSTTKTWSSDKINTAKQDTLVSGTNIKTINGNSLLGSGDIAIASGVTSFNTRTGAVTLSSTDVTTALGFTPYNATNPSGYITSSASITGSAATLTTARTLTIGSTGKTFNGSANVSWSLAEIGAGDVTLTGTQTLTNKTIDSGVYTGYTETTVVANTSTAYTINLANGTLLNLTLTGNCTFTFPTPTAGKSFILLLRQDSTGSRSVTWPTTVKWPASSAPILTSTFNKVDKFIFTADGTNWFGSNAGQNYL